MLNTEEKLVDADNRTKVKVTIENKLNQVLGIKREVVDVQAGKTQLKEKESAARKMNPPPAAEEVPAPTKVSKKSTVKSPPKEPAPAPRDTKEDVSLDDIANLFK